MATPLPRCVYPTTYPQIYTRNKVIQKKERLNKKCFFKINYRPDHRDCCLLNEKPAHGSKTKESLAKIWYLIYYLLIATNIALLHQFQLNLQVRERELTDSSV